MTTKDFAPIKPQALAGIDSVIAGGPFFAPLTARADIDAPELKSGSENRADGQDGVAASILATDNGGYPFDGKSTLPDGTPVTDPEQLIDRSPLTPDEIEYGLRVAAECGDSEIPNLAEGGVREAVSATDDGARVSADDDDETIVTMAAEYVQTEHAAEETTAREDDNPFQGKGRGSVRPDSEVIERLLASYSVQRKAVWRWCIENRSIITHDMPSARVAGKGAGVSYETARHVLSDFRFHYRLTPPAMTA